MLLLGLWKHPRASLLAVCGSFEFPFQIEMVPVERHAQLAQNKLEKLKQLLERITLKGGASSGLEDAADE